MKNGSFNAFLALILFDGSFISNFLIKSIHSVDIEPKYSFGNSILSCFILLFISQIPDAGSCLTIFVVSVL